MQEQKVSRLKDQMMSAKTNEQYRAFQKEIEYCQNEIRKMEDRILALMEESEPLEANVRKAEAALQEERRRVESEKAAARERTAQDQRAVEQLQRQREETVRQLAPAVYAAYERIRAKRGGLAVADASEGRCSACHIALRPQFFQDLRFLEQGVMFCESCGRILYYQRPVAVEDPAGDSAALDP
jgi:predicted  nucleic acid-binding Zn-ribbon protein